ncbi:cobyrinate a,c-diamide synthase [Lacrimispora sp. JR3]|uniref:cobyrinate a,c-diamide synthase n=1 Tax=Lacrimispora sinapis TaxID=3111456 RepID=UPI00374942D7
MSSAYKRLLLAAPKSGSGKTMITCGLLTALLNRNITCRSFKCGPDFIDPMFHKHVLGIDGGNLDSYFLEAEKVKHQFMDLAREAELSVIEGVMGYYDGVGGNTTKASSYEVACAVDAPVVLLLDCRGASLSLAAVVKGFLEYKENSHIKGVILNRTSEAMAKRLEPEIEALGVRVYGYLPECEEGRFDSRHLGLVLPGELEGLKEQLQRLAKTMETTIDMDGLLALAGQAPPLSPPDSKESGFSDLIPEDGEKKVSIGIAKDEAFCFYYQENLKLLEEMGARLVPFSPLHDQTLPKGLSGLIFGGGYPELYAKELSENTTMLLDIKNAYHHLIPILAECGGFMYLHEELETSDHILYPLAGIIKGKTFPTKRLSRFGYIETFAKEDTSFLKKGESVKGHEFHYWDSENNGDSLKAVKPGQQRSWDCVHGEGSLFAGFPHFYYPSNPLLPKRFIEACKKCQMEKRRKLKSPFPERIYPMIKELEKYFLQIRPLDEQAMEKSRVRWSHVAKPLNSLGALEKDIIKMAGICRTSNVTIGKRALVIMCGDNGVVEEGVTQTGMEVTAVVTENMTDGNSSVCIMAERAGVDVFPVDIGVARELRSGERYPLLRKKIAYGTRNFLREPAMTREETIRAIETGISIVEHLASEGYGLIATGEMGIGNTTTSSAVTSMLLKKDPELLTGRGAGLSDEGLNRKLKVIKEAVKAYEPLCQDGVDILSKVGGLDLAGLTGIFLGGAVYRVPILVDGFISAAAALAAERIHPGCRQFMLASHVSAEPAGRMLLDELGLVPLIQAGLCLGEGSGAVAAVPLLDMAADIYQKMSSFEEIQIEEYKPMGGA